MNDLRERVKEDRGLLKKIEMAIPGFRGYRKREDLRIADSLLRAQLAERLSKVGDRIELCKKELSKRMELEVLDSIGSLTNHIQMTQNRVKHAEHGYSGVSADYRIMEEELNRLYEWDLNLLSEIEKLGQAVDTLQSAINTANTAEIGEKIDTVEADIRVFNDLFDKRVETIANLTIIK